MKRSMKIESDQLKKRRHFIHENKEDNHSSKDENITELLLENQRLKLESKYRNEINELKAEILIELKAEILILKNKNTKLEKENHSLRYWGFEKNDIERRRQKFPWLPLYIREDKSERQSTQSNKGTVEWKDIPTDVVFCILKFVPDWDLFDFRVLSTKFYEAFYRQVSYEDCHICIGLAKRGRKFANLQFIECDDLTSWDIRAINLTNFPKLEGLSLGNSRAVQCLKWHPNLRKLSFTAYDWDDLKSVSTQKFPALVTLVFSTTRLMWNDKRNRLAHHPGHKSLKHFRFDACSPPSLEEIRELTIKFPLLQTVGISRRIGLGPEVLDFLEQQGIKFTDDFDTFHITIEGY